jgi:nitrite reductase/ring-hydroxylating ferredoxin subunit
MKSTVTFLGQAGLDVRLGSSRVVCDPWLSTGGAYLGAWHQFPDNSRLAAADLHDTPVLFIGSPRPDHLDVETLRAFPKTVQVVVPALPTRRLVEQLQQLGFGTVVELGDWQPFDLGGGAQLSVVASSTKHRLAATAIVELDGQVVVHQNDCLLDADALARLAAKQPALHVVQFSGPSYFPAAYDFPPDRMGAEVEKEMARRAASFYDALAGVAARHVVAIGGPCFLEGRTFEAGAGESLLPDADELVARTARERPELAERMRLLYPGDAAVAEGGDWQFAGRKPYHDKRRHLEELRRARRPLADGLLEGLRASAAPVEIKDLRSHLRDLFQFEDMTWDLGLLIQVRVSGGPSMWIDFRKKPYRFLTESEETASHVLTVDSAWMSLVLQEKLSWHDLLMAGLVSVHRGSEPGSEKLMAHFDFRHDGALFDLVRWLDPALITLQDEQMEYVCQRFCPHRGRDLEYAVIERGVLTCTAHGWRFDLRKGGKCLWGGDAPLIVKEIRPLRR